MSRIGSFIKQLEGLLSSKAFLLRLCILCGIVDCDLGAAIGTLLCSILHCFFTSFLLSTLRFCSQLKKTLIDRLLCTFIGGIPWQAFFEILLKQIEALLGVSAGIEVIVCNVCNEKIDESTSAT